MRLFLLAVLAGQLLASLALAGQPLDIYGLRPGMGGMEALGLAEDLATGPVLRSGAVDAEMLAGTAERCAGLASEEFVSCETQRKTEATYLSRLSFVVDGEAITVDMTGPISGNRVFRVERSASGRAHADLVADLVARFGEPEAIVGHEAVPGPSGAGVVGLEMPVAERWCETQDRCLQIGGDGVVRLYDAGVEAGDQLMRAKLRKALDEERAE